MAFRRRVPMRRSGNRRETSWFGIALTITSLGDSGTSLLAALNALGLAKRPFTIVRTYLEVMVTSDQITSTETGVGAIGMAVVSDQASAIGITAIPTPVTDLASDLFYLHQIVMTRISLITSAGFEMNSGQNYSLDSKAMRKVNDDQDVILVAETAAAPSAGLIFNVMGRFLVKEH